MIDQTQPRSLDAILHFELMAAAERILAQTDYNSVRVQIAHHYNLVDDNLTVAPRIILTRDVDDQ